MNVEEIKRVISSSYCKSDATKKLGFPMNGTGGRQLQKLLDKYDIDISHFDRGKKNRKYRKIIKKCPVCSTPFEALKGSKREKQTCSYGCSNTLFRTGNRGNRSCSAYRTICWRYHEKKCVICGEDKIVEVHHYNEDHDDNRPENLIPLCPTHHKYWHSRYRCLIEDKVRAYAQKFSECKSVADTPPWSRDDEGSSPSTLTN